MSTPTNAERARDIYDEFKPGWDKPGSRGHLRRKYGRERIERLTRALDEAEERGRREASRGE